MLNPNFSAQHFCGNKSIGNNCIPADPEHWAGIVTLLHACSQLLSPEQA